MTDYILLLYIPNINRVGNEAKNDGLKRFLGCKWDRYRSRGLTRCKLHDDDDNDDDDDDDDDCTFLKVT